jgi:hypothetical protein
MGGGRRRPICLHSRIQSSVRDAIGVSVLRAYLKMDHVWARPSPPSLSWPRLSHMRHPLSLLPDRHMHTRTVCEESSHWTGIDTPVPTWALAGLLRFISSLPKTHSLLLNMLHMRTAHSIYYDFTRLISIQATVSMLNSTSGDAVSRPPS